MTRIIRVRGARGIERCIPVLLELRDHLSAEECRRRIRRQVSAGYRLAYLEARGGVQGVAGYRVVENLCCGKQMYLDDLVVRAGAQNRGYGGRLMEWLMAEARGLGCGELHLDSGVQRAGAHGFYFKHRFQIRYYHFARSLR